MEPKEANYFHKWLAKYFDQKPLYLDEPTQKKPNIRKLVEQPWQHFLSGEVGELHNLLTNFFFFLNLYEFSISDIIDYWKKIKNKYSIKTSYLVAWETWKKNETISLRGLIKAAYNIGFILECFSNSKNSLTFYNKALNIAISYCGKLGITTIEIKEKIERHKKKYNYKKLEKTFNDLLNRFGSSHPFTINAATKLLCYLQNQGRKKEANILFGWINIFFDRQNIKISEEYLEIINNYLSYLLAIGEKQKAQEFLRRLVEYINNKSSFRDPSDWIIISDICLLFFKKRIINDDIKLLVKISKEKLAFYFDETNPNMIKIIKLFNRLN